jgi:uncharacterized low-complexity protein
MMKSLALRSGGAALAAALAFSACAGGSMTPAPGGFSANTLRSPLAKNACGAAQVGYVFGGRCGSAQIKSHGGRGGIPPYLGYSARIAFGANTGITKKAVFVMRDATGNGDISGTLNGNAWPAFTGSGTAFLYLAVNNTSASTVSFQKTPAIVVTNIKKTGFPGTTCALYALTSTGWVATGVTGTPTGKKGRTRLTFAATQLSAAVSSPPGPSYFGLACQ